MELNQHSTSGGNVNFISKRFIKNNLFTKRVNK